METNICNFFIKWQTTKPIIFKIAGPLGLEKVTWLKPFMLGNIIGEGDQSGHIRERKEVVNFGNECKKLEVDTATSSHVQCIIIKIITPRSTFITSLHLNDNYWLSRKYWINPVQPYIHFLLFSHCRFFMWLLFVNEETKKKFTKLETREEFRAIAAALQCDPWKGVDCCNDHDDQLGQHAIGRFTPEEDRKKTCF